ncbi:NHS-like protein 3 isoform X2 [Parambassis ranga]|uniref:NHS-like protein 3 isoform X2 n=1 Tax=Parambassis ranga TaxID=210632 RepID=A0A6P7I5S9_9TELE|nr:uncharacterized protein KIAA1522 homolog isoform X2 [Parambassis ranga]
MGNSVQKKKKAQTEKNLSSPQSQSPKQEKPSWLFGRPDKLKTAGPKGNEDQKRLTVHYTPSQHYQENVFIEGSRPQYLEDLHIEAQEGLKILQQEEHKNGVNFPDNESVASTDTLCPEQDFSSKDRDGSPESMNTDTTVTSTVLTRPVLTHQGSTFKPLNPVKRLDKTRKRSRRTTIMGIPNQVQKELALHRSSTFQPLVSIHLPNHERHVSDSQSGVVIIPTVNGGTPAVKKEGARVHLSELEAFKDEQLVREHLQAMYHDEQSVNHQGFGSYLYPTSTLRPKSLAVSGMTTSCSLTPSMFTFFQEPQGPVMSISPQATYLSTIIPNAVLPASIEVIEIDRSTSRTRGSSTVSKSSLTSGDSSASPLLSRRSDGDGSQTHNSNDNPTLMSTSVSGSNWSESQSSKTIISNSSPVSSKSSTRSGNSQKVGVNVQESHAEHSGGDQELVSLCSSASVTSNLSSKNENTVRGPGSGSAAPASAAAEEHAKNKHNFTRSLSVMKTKQPPAPPRRTNSLHNNKIRSTSRILVDSKDLSDSASGEATTATRSTAAEDDTNKNITPVSNSTGSPAPSAIYLNPMQTSSIVTGGARDPPPEASPSSPQKTPSEGGKFERTMSPSSGYSSQSGTPTLSPKEISPISPDKQKKTPVKPERSVSRASSAASPSSSLTSLSSGTSELANADISTGVPPQAGSPPTTATKNNSSFRAEIRDLLNIPPPPKVKAPCPPPPETWAHNRCTFELLCGSCPNVSKVTQKQDSTDKQTGTQSETNKDTDVSPENHTNKPVLELTENKSMTEPLPVMYSSQDVQTEQEGSECPDTEQVKSLIQNKTEENVDVKRPSSSAVKDPDSQEVTPKKEPPPVMKKPTNILRREEAVLTEQQTELGSSATTEVHSPAESHKTSSQNGLTVLVDENENEVNRSDIPSMQTLSIEIPKIHKVSPPPTPPPAYHPTPPLSRKMPSSCVSVPPNELQIVQEETHVVESCWPPPPPPLEGDSVFDGGEEVDFPPPPPPDSVPDVMDSCVTVRDHSPPGPMPQPVVTNKKPVVVVQVSNTDDEVSCKSISSGVSPPLEESPPIPPVTRAESPVTVMAVLPPSTFLKQNSLKTEAQSASVALVSPQSSAPTAIPVAPPLPAENLTHGVNFRRQPSVANRDARSKELLSRHKSAPIPKEDANIPLVTPSLLQMVRLRSVNMTEDQGKAPSEDKPTNEGTPVQENTLVLIQGSQSIPQKPIRKSLSLKSPPQNVKTPSVTISTPSMRLQEAIRIKTAAMSSRDSLPCRLGVRSPTYSCMNEPGALSPKPPEGCDVLKSPASTASFIFSRSTKRVVIETPAASSPEAQASLKQSLAAELMQVSDQSKAAAFSNGGVKCERVPPPVAKKPAQSSITPSQNPLSFSAKMELGEGSGAIGVTPPEITTTRVTADTIETLF